MSKTRSFLLATLLIFSSLGFAQQSSQKINPANGMQPATENCAFNFSSGSGLGLTKFCVTANGNIAQFAAMGLNGLLAEMLDGVAPAIEGYGLCDTKTLTPYFDYASSDSGNWGTATAVATANSVTITRTTADGVWKLLQVITQMQGTKTSSGAARTDMAITNLSTADRILIVYRHANIDAAGSTFNDFAASTTTAFGTVPSGGNGLSSEASLLATAFDFHFALVKTSPGGVSPCVPFGSQGDQQTPFEGDGAVDHYFNLDIRPGATKRVTVTYKPI